MSEPPLVSDDLESSFIGQPALRSKWWIWPVLACIFAIDVTLLIICSRGDGDPTKQEIFAFAVAGIGVLPFIPLVVAAQLGKTSATARGLTFGYWLFIATVAVVMAGMLTFAGVFDFALAERLPPEKSMDAIAPGGLRKTMIAIGFTSLAALMGFAAFTLPGRKLVARFTPIDPHSFTSATAFATVIVLFAASIVPLMVLREPPALLIIENMKNAKEAPIFANDTSLRGLYYQLAWVIPFAVLAAGFPLTRDFRDSLDRLGLGRLSIGQFIGAIFIAASLVALMEGILPPLDRFWKHMGWPTTDENRFNELVKFALSGWGAIAIGVTAGIGEELAFRGLLQPRLGLLVTNILFAGVHGWQYNWDALLAVFLIGLVCGLVRKYMNTTASIIVHGVFDTLAVLLTVAQQNPAH